MRHIILFLTLSIFLTGCDDHGRASHISSIDLGDVATMEELQQSCEEMNKIEGNKPFYTEKYNYKPIIGTYVKSSVTLPTLKTEEHESIGSVVLNNDGFDNHLIFKNYDATTGQKFKDYRIFKIYDKKIQKVISPASIYNKKTYGICAYLMPVKNRSKTGRLADIKLKRKIYYGDINTLTRIEN